MTRRTGTARLAALAVLASVPAVAGGRPDTRAMTCAEANGFIRSQGAVVMTTGARTFRRFVANRGFCDPWEILKPAYAPTRDTARCVIHSVCEEPVWRFDAFGRD